MGHSTAMLRCAQHLAAQRDRPFASLRVTMEGPISSSVLFFATALSRPLRSDYTTCLVIRHRYPV